MKKERYFKVRAINDSKANCYNEGDEFVGTLENMFTDRKVFRDVVTGEFYAICNFKILFECDRKGNSIEFNTSVKGEWGNKPTMTVTNFEGDKYKVYKEVVVNEGNAYYKRVNNDISLGNLLSVQLYDPYIKPSYTLNDLKRIVEEERGEFTYIEE